MKAPNALLFSLMMVWASCAILAEPVDGKDFDPPKPEFMGLYAVEGKILTELTPDSKGLALSAEVRFLYFGHHPDRTANLLLQRLPPEAQRIARDRPREKSAAETFSFQSIQEDYERGNEILSGKVRGASAVDLRLKPYVGETNMMWLVPRSALEPGEYQIGVAGVQLNQHVRFRVGGVGRNIFSSPDAGPAKRSPSPFVLTQATDQKSGNISPLSLEFIDSDRMDGKAVLRVRNNSQKTIRITGTRSTGPKGEEVSKHDRELRAGRTHDFLVAKKDIKEGDTLEFLCEGFDGGTVYRFQKK